MPFIYHDAALSDKGILIAYYILNNQYRHIEKQPPGFGRLLWFIKRNRRVG